MKRKELLVTLNVPSDVLKEFPQFETPKKSGTASLLATPTPKSKLKVPAKNAKKGSVTASPGAETPLEGTPGPAGKTSLSKVQNADDLKLDKSGRPVRKWVKKPLEIQSFTGYYMNFKSWTGLCKTNDYSGSQKPLKIQIKLNNKNLNTVKNEPTDSRDQSPQPDDASSVITTPDQSRMSTPLP
jgi:hypothetical protein